MANYLCEIFNVSRSGYYRHLTINGQRQERRKRSMGKSHDRKGLCCQWFARHQDDLTNEYDIYFNRKKNQRLMRKYQIVCPIRKANPYKRMSKTTKEHQEACNKLNREFQQETSRKDLLTDITYLPYGSGKGSYLSTAKNAATKEILA